MLRNTWLSEHLRRPLWCDFPTGVRIGRHLPCGFDGNWGEQDDEHLLECPVCSTFALVVIGLLDFRATCPIRQMFALDTDVVNDALFSEGRK